MTSNALQTPANPLPLVLLAAAVSLIVGIIAGAINPIAGIMVPPILGGPLLLGIAIRYSGTQVSERDAWSLMVSVAIICVPLGTVGTLIAA